MKRVLIAIFVVMLTGTLFAQSANTDSVIVSAKVAVVETESGKVQGLVHTGTYTFRGIPYAQAERFMPPTKVPKWEGVRKAITYGHSCPQMEDQSLEPMQLFLSGHRFWPQNEKCQYLNIWTPGASDGKKRPVMVWLHGGGYFSGSAVELYTYDGDNLSKKGDVVVVSINHRLNVLGFLNLSAYGDKYKYSAQTSIMDMVAALQWVKANIGNFGGDPDNVTIFGQSGGGGKVMTLLGTPAANGLFHKAIVESGAARRMGGGGDQKMSRRIAEYTLQFAGLDSSRVDELQKIPYEKLSEASMKALRKVSEEAGMPPGLLGFPAVNWSPVVDGDYLPAQPFGTAAPEQSSSVPLLIGSNLNEFAQLNPMVRDRDTWNVEQVKNFFQKQYGDKAGAIVAAFQKAYPGMKPGDYTIVDTMMRPGHLIAARMKSEQKAPVYQYLFTWKSPVLDGFWQSGHSLELNFVFNQVEIGRESTGGGPGVEKLTDQMSQAWINFAKTGNPNHKGIPNWPAFTRENGSTMIIDTKWEVRNNHDKELMSLLAPEK